jgi:hypothetical protein
MFFLYQEGESDECPMFICTFFESLGYCETILKKYNNELIERCEYCIKKFGE